MVRVIVQLDTHASSDAEREVLAAFRSIGIGVQDIEVFRKNPPVGGMTSGDIWTLVILVSLTTSLTQLMKNAADDAYPILKKGAHLGIKHLIETFREVRGHTREKWGFHYALVDTVTGVSISLPPDLPDKAYYSLSRLDLSYISGARLRYDFESEQWQAFPPPGARYANQMIPLRPPLWRRLRRALGR